MGTLTTSLFAASEPGTIGVCYHNVGSGLHRASHPDVVKKMEDPIGLLFEE